MEGKFCGVSLFYLWLLLGCIEGVQSAESTLDVTTYGAKPGGSDISQALLSAWKVACGYTKPSTILVPKGDYAMNQVKLKGPCKVPIELQVEGHIKAPANPSQMKQDGEWIEVSYLDRFTLSGGGTFDGQGATAWKQNDCAKTDQCTKLPNSFSFNFLNNSIIRDITSLDSKLFHVSVFGCNNLQFSHVKLTAPERSLNTDGIHIGRSHGVTIADSVISTGDDCVSIGDGAKQIHVNRITCGPGHGISVGSLGRYDNEEPVDGIFVRNCTLVNTMNGVRVKTWPDKTAGIATNMHFDDIIMRNVSNPILIDQLYCPSNQCSLSTPSRVKISRVSFNNIRGTSASPAAVQLVCSKSHPCEGVRIGDIDLTYHGKLGKITTNCANVQPSFVGKQNPPICVKSAHSS